MTTTYLVTGATRGIGAALVEQLAKKDNVHVIAGVRNAKDAKTQALVTKYGNSVTVVEIDSSSDESPARAAEQLSAQGVQTIDVVIANAGVSGEQASAATLSIDKLRDVLNVNSIAPLVLFQAFRPFLQRSNNARFLVVSSLVGSFEAQDGIFNDFEGGQGKFSSYVISKTAANIVTKRISLESPWLTAIPIHPGLVQTDMATDVLGKEAVEGAVSAGQGITSQSSAEAILTLVDSATHDEHSGHFYDVQATKIIAF